MSRYPDENLVHHYAQALTVGFQEEDRISRNLDALLEALLGSDHHVQRAQLDQAIARFDARNR